MPREQHCLTVTESREARLGPDRPPPLLLFRPPPSPSSSFALFFSHPHASALRLHSVAPRTPRNDPRLPHACSALPQRGLIALIATVLTPARACSTLLAPAPLFGPVPPISARKRRTYGGPRRTACGARRAGAGVAPHLRLHAPRCRPPSCASCSVAGVPLGEAPCWAWSRVFAFGDLKKLFSACDKPRS